HPPARPRAQSHQPPRHAATHVQHDHTPPPPRPPFHGIAHGSPSTDRACFHGPSSSSSNASPGSQYNPSKGSSHPCVVGVTHRRQKSCWHTSHVTISFASTRPSHMGHLVHSRRS